ncbi:MAG: hypothetical protein ACYSU5_23300, partial [Planctomycetota bacterium]
SENGYGIAYGRIACGMWPAMRRPTIGRATCYLGRPLSSLKACFMSNIFLSRSLIYPYGFHPSHLFAVKAT